MKDIKLSSIKKVKPGVYLLNDKLQISEMKFDEEQDGGIFVKMDFCDSEISEDDANLLVDQFIGDAINNIIGD